MVTDRRSLVIAPSPSTVRRRLGPTAWLVFEELVADSTGDPPNPDVAATTRSLAEALGLSKDTVARALTKLHPAGLVEARQDRTSLGAFTAGRYRIVVPGSVRVIDSAPDRPAAAKRDRAVQLSLLDPATGAL